VIERKRWGRSTCKEREK